MLNWSMACSTGRINGLFRKAHRWQLASRVCTVEQLAGTADAGLFKAIASNPNHSLYQILPPFRPHRYSLCKCGHLFLVHRSNRISNVGFPWRTCPNQFITLLNTYHSNAMGICGFVKNNFFRDFFSQIVAFFTTA